jgi:hypothetical protein
MHDSLPATDLVRLREDVLSKRAEAALPCNLSLEWIRLIGRDIDRVFEEGVSTEVGATHLAAPLALIAHLLCAKSAHQRAELDVDTLVRCCSSYRTELALEAINRGTDMRASSATLETIFTDRDVEFSEGPGVQVEVSPVRFGSSGGAKASRMDGPTVDRVERGGAT